MPPPRAAGDTPDTLFRAMTLLRITGVPAAKSEMPPPFPPVRELSVMTFASITAALAPLTLMPAPPTPPEHPLRTFPVIWLSTIRGEPKLTLIPTPSQPLFPVMTLPSIVGEAFDTATPLPKKPPPLVMVNPRSTAPRPSPELNVTTTPPAFPSIVVAAGPASLVTMIAFPEKLIRSTYVPGATSTVSPWAAAPIPAWIVG